MESPWLMRCHYCGVAITPPDEYQGEVPGVARGQRVEVTFQAGGVGPGRVEYVFVLCPLCHHMLRTSGWGPPADDGADDGVWLPLLPTAPVRTTVGSGRGRPAPPGRFSSASYGGPRSACGGPHQGSTARKSARNGTSIRHSDHGAPVRRLRLAVLVVLVLCVAAFVGMLSVAFFLL